MRYRWDPAYPMGRRDTQAYDARLRASDDERNAVADKLSRHYAEGRLDEVEFKNRLDTAMSATTRGDLNGLFDDLPRLPSEPPPPPRGTAGSCPGSSSWPSSPSLPARPCPSIRCTTCRGSSSPSSASSCGGGPVGTRWAPPPPAPPPGRRARPARSWTTEPTPCTQRTPPAHDPAQPPSPDRATPRPGDGRRPGHAALPGALRRPPRRRARGDRRPLRPLHRPPRAGGPGAGRARPDVARHHGRARHRAARRHADRAARAG